MTLPKLYETKKLHYGEYLYKLVLSNQLSTIFRTEVQRHGKLGFAKEQLNNLHEKYIQGEPLEKQIFRTTRIIPNEDYLDAVDIYAVLKFANNYKIRIDPHSRISIYTNDKELTNKIIRKMRKSNAEFWEPDSSVVHALLEQKNIILIDNPTCYPIKLTFGTQSVDNSFAKWLESNRDKSKVGSITLESIKNGHDLNGLYFFVRDEKVLSLISMLVGHNIRRIDKLVYKENIDK